MRLLLVEDDAMIGESVLEALRQERYAVDWARSGNAAEWDLATTGYDLVLLDLGLPGKEGLDVLRSLRKSGSTVPVLIVSARGQPAARVEGLDLGADDYLVKPFDLDELLARVRALLRRHGSRASSVVTHGALTVDFASHSVELDGATVHLAPMEFSLLRALLDAPGKVVSRRQLEERLYGPDEEVESNALDVFVLRLRRKFGTGFIKTVRGVGYRVPGAS